MGAFAGLHQKKRPRTIEPANRRFCGVITFWPPSLRPTRPTVRVRVGDALLRRMMPRMRRSEGGGKKRASQIFLLGRRRQAALDRRTPLQGHGRPKKNSKQQSTCGRRRVRAAGGLGGVMKVTPYGHVPNDGRAAALDCQKLPPPSPGSKKTQQRLKQQSIG